MSGNLWPVPRHFLPEHVVPWIEGLADDPEGVIRRHLAIIVADPAQPRRYRDAAAARLAELEQ